MNRHDATLAGRGYIKRYLARFQYQNRLVELQDVANFDQYFQNENIPARTENIDAVSRRFESTTDNKARRRKQPQNTRGPDSHPENEE